MTSLFLCFMPLKRNIGARLVLERLECSFNHRINDEFCQSYGILMSLQCSTMYVYTSKDLRHTFTKINSFLLVGPFQLK